MATSSEILLYPELLNNDQLICIIQQRHLHIDNLETMSRNDLLEVFRNYCVPYGQRKYRDTGRGKVLNKTRQGSPDPAPAPKLNLFDSHSSKTTFSNCERLKPPPDILAGHMKRIKLETFSNDLNISKRRIPIESDTGQNGSPPVKKNKKPITWP